MAYLIMLDAGHGGQDPGAVYKGRQEKNDNLKLALAVGEILKIKGLISLIPVPVMSIRHLLRRHSLQIRQE